MTTAHRPTFDPARGKEALRGPAYHQRLLPAHTSLKRRQPDESGAKSRRDLKAELERAEKAHHAKRNGLTADTNEAEADGEATAGTASKLELQDATRAEDAEEEDPESKRRRLILEEAREMDADSDSNDESSEESSDEEDDDEEAMLQRELEMIRKERADAKAKEEAEVAAQEQEKREFDIARGNPLLNSNSGSDFGVKRRWDDDVVFKNQARGSDDKKQMEFVNDLLRSDFHKRFMSKYVR